MDMNIRNNLEEIKETRNKNKMIDVQIEQLEHDYDINLEHISYLRQDIEKTLCNKYESISYIRLEDGSLRLKMNQNIDLKIIKEIGDIFGVDDKAIKIKTSWDKENPYISIVVDF